jgi:predicted ATP-dependent protease
MALRELKEGETGLTRFGHAALPEAGVFELSSHVRAREALDFALSVGGLGFNVFVVGEDRSGRMTATLAYLRERLAGAKAPDDWVYLNNFRNPHRPRPCALPAGRGRVLCDAVTTLIGVCRAALERVFNDDQYRHAVQELSRSAQQDIDLRLRQLHERARSAGLDLVRTNEGLAIVAADQAEQAAGKPPAERPAPNRQDAAALQGELAEIGRQAAQLQAQLAARLGAMRRQLAEAAITGPIEAVITQFARHRRLTVWLRLLKDDLLDNLDLLLAGSEEPERRAALERRYAVNLLVDRGDADGPIIVLEPTPTLARVFGAIEYRQAGGALTTDHTLIRAGALHRANGGVLILRAEAIAREAGVWEALKAALRDRVIRIAQPDQEQKTRLAGSPEPKAIPLNVKVILVGSPHWYYSFFAIDSDFQTYFKIKADIAPDMPADRENVARYAAIIQSLAREACGMKCSAGAVELLLGFSARRADHRARLSARFELLSDILTEAGETARGANAPEVTEQAVLAALTARRRRNARSEDRIHEEIARGVVLIDTHGRAVGQINALVVHDLRDHAFGLPVRVTARSSVGRSGLVNIERDTTLGGPIQQKAVMVIQGFLAGHFARSRPLSFNCSLTFEQSYGGVEGDSASVAELLAVLSDLSGLTLRQDIAVTGSINQVGVVQAVGGVSHKIEGFYRVCEKAGPLTGTQGVLVPASNRHNVVLVPEVSAAIAAGQFHVWTAETVEDAIELMIGAPAGAADQRGEYPDGTVFHAVARQLDRFNAILTRAGLGGAAVD